MGVLNWLRSLGIPWLGPDLARETGGAAELERERIRVRYAAASGRYTFLPFSDPNGGETEAMRRAYQKMLAEPTIKSAMLDKVLSVAALDLGVNPGDDRPQDKVGAEFGDYLINRLPDGLRGLVESVILPGLIAGHSLSEKVWQVEEHGKYAGKLILKALKTKPTDSYRLNVDEFDNVIGVEGYGLNSGECFELSNYVLFMHLPIYGLPTSDFRAAYAAYWKIDTAWKLRMIFLDKYSAGPMLHGQYTDPNNKDALDEALEAAKASTWLSTPIDAQVEAINLATSGTADFKAAIDDLKHEVFLGIGGAVLQALEGSTTEGRGSSAIHKSTADVRKWHIKSCVEQVVNRQIFPDAIDLNYVGVAYPIATLGGVNDAEMASSLAIDQGLHLAGVPLSLADLRKRYGRPEPKDAADTLAPPAAPGGVLPPALLDSVGGYDTDTAPVDPAVAPTEATPPISNDLRTTVGGSAQIAALQKDYWADVISREAAVANVVIIFGLPQTDAERLFPPKDGSPPTPLPPVQPGIVAAEPPPPPPPVQQKPDLVELAKAFLAAKKQSDQAA